VYPKSSRNNASIFHFSILCDGKVNIVGELGKSKLLIVFESAEKRKEKLRKNGNFNAKLVFDKIDFGFWCNSKKK